MASLHRTQGSFQIEQISSLRLQIRAFNFLILIHLLYLCAEKEEAEKAKEEEEECKLH